MRVLKVCLSILVCLILMPSAASAQASITGTVRDTSGAVLPGVTVEASNAALIEKVRSAVTDGSGQYRIVDLRAGTYTVTFALPGFSTVKREGVELTGTFTASINAEMTVGTLEETITVTGETPIVDTQSVRRQISIADDLIAAMPAARSYAGIMMLLPATQTSAGANLDIQVTPGVIFFGGTGGRNNEGRIQVDGLNTAIQGPGRWNIDMGLSRPFPLGQQQVQLRLETFNLLNTVNPANPVSVMSSPDFGRITELAGWTAPRIMQLAVKYLF